jgi:transposase
LHVGSVQAGPKVAALFSVIESCRRLGVPTKDYLLDVLPGLSRSTRSEYTQLTPARWLSTHP